MKVKSYKETVVVDGVEYNCLVNLGNYADPILVEVLDDQGNVIARSYEFMGVEHQLRIMKQEGDI